MTSHFPTIAVLLLGAGSAPVDSAESGKLLSYECSGGFCASECQLTNTTVVGTNCQNTSFGSETINCERDHGRSCGRVLIGNATDNNNGCGKVVGETTFICGMCNEDFNYNTGQIGYYKYECDANRPEQPPTLVYNCDSQCEVCLNKKEVPLDGGWYSNNVYLLYQPVGVDLQMPHRLYAEILQFKR